MLATLESALRADKRVIFPTGQCERQPIVCLYGAAASPETAGLYYARARSTRRACRFHATDPIGYEGVQPVTYVNNDPLNTQI